MADKDSRAGGRYASREILAFVERAHLSPDSAAAASSSAHRSDHAALMRAFEAPERHGLPSIQVSLSEGYALTLLMRLLGARNVIEVGTLAGFSALCLARGMQPGGKLLSLEIDPKAAEVARANIANAGMSDRIEVLLGPALQTLESLARARSTPLMLDAMFLDADKEGYPDYARWGLSQLRPGGLLIADNSYFFGELLADRPAAARMREFHELVGANFDSTCLPTPDGMVLAIRR